MSGFLTYYAETQMLNKYLRHTATQPTSIYMELATQSYQKDGTINFSGTEIPNADYARSGPITFTASTTAQDGSNPWGYAYSTHPNKIEFPKAKSWWGAGSTSQQFAALCDASSGGNPLYAFTTTSLTPYGGGGCIARYQANTVQPRLEARGTPGFVVSVLKKMLDWILGISDYTPPTSFQVALATDYDLYAGTFSEYSPSGYARSSVSFPTAAYNATPQQVISDGTPFSFTYFVPGGGSATTVSPVLLDQSGNLQAGFGISFGSGGFTDPANYTVGCDRLRIGALN